MSGSLAPRLVLVTRETEYEGLLARHATPGAARAFVARRARVSAEAHLPPPQSVEVLDAQREQLGAMLAQIRAAVPKGWRIAQVRRNELDRFLFGPEDVVVAVGQDGLVANVAKYLSGQPVIGVNGDPARNPGILVPHTVEAAASMLERAAAGTLPLEERTMVRAELDDGQALLALNEVFVGHSSHQSARYSLSHAGTEEAQSSSGLIVASGTGATGWALSISQATGVAVDVEPNEAAAVFLVREPWPSRATGAALRHGRLGPGDALLVVSRMNEGGTVFADGMEHDRLDFAWGRTLRVTVADRRLRFVPGTVRAGPGLRPPPRAVRIAPASAPPAPATPVQAPATPVARASAPPRRRVWRWASLLLVLLGACWLLFGGEPPAEGPPPPPARSSLAR